MLVEEYMLDNTKIRFYDDYIVKNTTTQKEYIDSIIVNLINKNLTHHHMRSLWVGTREPCCFRNKTTPYSCNLSNFHI